MDYHQFISEAAKVTAGEPLDREIRLRANLDGAMSVVCGTPDQIPVDDEGCPTQYILSTSYITVADFYGFFHGHLELPRQLEIEWKIKEMIAGANARLEELTGRSSASSLLNVFTLQEAAEYWGVSQEAISKWVQRKRFNANEMKKSGNVWLVTRGGMVRLTGRFGGDLFLIYKLTNKETRDVYVGCTDRTLDTEKKWLQKNLRILPEKLRSELKHGISKFEWEVLEHVCSKEAAEDRHRYWINHFKSDINGYN